MLNLPGYQALAVIHRGAQFSVYRGSRDADSSPVVIKIHAQAYPSLAELTKLRQEYEVAATLDVPGVVRCYALEKRGNAPALIMEDFGAISLRELLDAGPVSIEVFLRISGQLAETLRAVHAKGVIHKDIKPENIVLTRDGSVVKIIDFGIASLLSGERKSINASRRLEGTLTHMSPEQTGRTNRTLDQRADLYSLGVTFYEMLTGSLPFSTRDPLEMLHCQLAKTPEAPSLRNPAVPEALSAIVMKLLAKMPEDRYRSAAGLKKDLDRCSDALARFARIEIDTLGELDGRDVFQIPQKLYGREAEVEVLLSVFDRVSEGAAEMLLVSGYSGVGKSSLIHEVHRPIVAKRGNFISGKFDQYKRNTPYESFAQAFKDLVRQVLAEDERHVNEWRHKLLAALGSSGKLVIDVIPEVELILGEQPALPSLSGADAQRRFNETFCSFLRVFTSREHPLVIFLDDLQWADAGTLSLLHLFMTEPDMRHLLLIGAYRDNEVSPHHPMSIMLEDSRAAGARISEVVLQPFSLADLGGLLADTLHCRPEDAAPLTELVLRKTNGNPFFVGQLLRSLHEGGLFYFDVTRERWRWDLEAIEKKEITENVIDLIGDRIRKLDPETQAALKMAACIGNTFDLKTLSVVHRQSPKQTAAVLWKALADTLVIPVSESYKLPRIYDLDALDDPRIRELAEGTRYKFLHDRVQQAAYSLIPDDQLKSIHLEIGRLWLASVNEEDIEESLFEIVNHKNAGIDLITDRTELYRLVELTLLAARKAKVSSAFEAALQLLTRVMDHLPEGAWAESYRVTLSLHLEMGEAELLNGHYGAALAVLDRAEARVTDVLDRCRICELKVLIYKMRNDLVAAFDTGAGMLKILGVELDRFCDERSLHEELLATSAVLAARPREDLARQPEMTDPRQIATCRILQEIWSVAFFLGSLGIHVAAMKMVQISAVHGNTSASVFGYMVYAFAQVFFFGNIEEGYQLGRLSLELNDRFQTREVEAKLLDMWGGLIQHYKEDISSCKDTLWRGYTRGMELGDYQWAGYCAINYGHYAVLGCGPLREAVAHIERVLPSLRRYNQNMTNLHLVLRETIASLEEDRADPVRLDGVHCEEGEIARFGAVNNDLNTACILSFYKLCLAVCFGATDGILALAAEAERTIAGAAGVWTNPLFHFFQSVALLDVRDQVSPAERDEHLRKVESNLAKLKKWASHAPGNFAHLVSLIEAELCRIAGAGDRAMLLYDEAIAQARDQGFAWSQALTCERASRFYRVRGAERVAGVYLRDARYAYLLWGAEAKVRQLDARHPELSEPADRGGSAPPDVDLLAITKASQAISGELVLGKLLEMLMRTAIESAGAETGLLMLARSDGRLFIEASSRGHEDGVLPIPVESCEFVPRKIIRYAVNARTAVLLDNASSGGAFATDESVVKRGIRAVLCQPILRRGQLTGLLYLENNLVAGAFAPGRVKALDLLATQIAISLENAQLYDSVERRVEERTRELLEAQEQLRDQIGLIQQQQEAMHAMSAPIIEVWDQVLVLPVIGILDSRRAAVMTESLLDEVQRRQTAHAILDLTGVEEVNEETADHLRRVFLALRLLGTNVILTGLRGKVAQAIVALGLDLSAITTMRSVKEALRRCGARGA